MRAVADVAVVVLTYNEELNIGCCLGSVQGWAKELFVVDSLSTDATVTVARQHSCVVAQRSFLSYADQRNWALDTLPISANWVLFLDADEWLTDALKQEISEVLARDPVEDGFRIKRRFYWNGVWVRRGYYPTWLLRLFRRGRGRCEAREINEHIVVFGKIGNLRNDFVHQDSKPVSCWVDRHNRYAKMEAGELLRGALPADYVQARLMASGAERNRWLRYRLYNRMPPLIRPLLYFTYTCVLRGGFLDGKQAVIYHFLHSLWYPLLIDLNYREMRAAAVGFCSAVPCERMAVRSERLMDR